MLGFIPRVDASLSAEAMGSPIFFIYIGLNIAAVAFLMQYLNFPKQLLTDLSNLREDGFPRILCRAIRQHFNDTECRCVVSYFFQLDYVTYALLMFIIYSVLMVITLAGEGMKALHPSISVLSLWALTLLYSVLRGLVVYYGALKKVENGDYQRGHGHWNRRERLTLIGFEIVLWALLVTLVIITTFLWRLKLLFLGLVALLALMFAWHLWVTYRCGPVTKLLSVWMQLANMEADPQPAGAAPNVHRRKETSVLLISDSLEEN